VVGVVESWQWPDPFADVSAADAKEVQRRIAEGEWRADQRSEPSLRYWVLTLLNLPFAR
jgi:hypothetical protein